MAWPNTFRWSAGSPDRGGGDGIPPEISKQTPLLRALRRVVSLVPDAFPLAVPLVPEALGVPFVVLAQNLA